jgi:hypothetical protein
LTFYVIFIYLLFLSHSSLPYVLINNQLSFGTVGKIGKKTVLLINGTDVMIVVMHIIFIWLDRSNFTTVAIHIRFCLCGKDGIMIFGYAFLHKMIRKRSFFGALIKIVESMVSFNTANSHPINCLIFMRLGC